MDPTPTIIALTGGTMPEERLACLEAGMDDFVAKPLTFERLQEVLERVSQHSEQNRLGAVR